MRSDGEAAVIGIKDLAKLFSVTVVTGCAVFVCTLFLNYNLDLAGRKDSITTVQEQIWYDAQVAVGKVTAGISGACLAGTTAVLLIFYLKNHIDSHGRELGVLKALGHSDFRVARSFWVFGISVGAGTVLGCAAAHGYMPAFYDLQSTGLPSLAVQPRPHALLIGALLVLPTAFFMLLAVVYAFVKLKKPAIDLLKDKTDIKGRVRQKKGADCPFLTELRKNTLRSRKILVFFIGFSAFCFSAMTQMSMAMKRLESGGFSWMILLIGLLLAFMTLLMSLSGVIKANAKTIAMMKTFGYTQRECGSSLFGSCRPVAFLGFAIGTAYQYFLLRILLDAFFSDFEQLPQYSFDGKAMLLSFAVFLISYECIFFFCSRKIGRQSVKSIMLA